MVEEREEQMQQASSSGMAVNEHDVVHKVLGKRRRHRRAVGRVLRGTSRCHSSTTTLRDQPSTSQSTQATNALKSKMETYMQQMNEFFTQFTSTLQSVMPGIQLPTPPPLPSLSPMHEEELYSLKTVQFACFIINTGNGESMPKFPAILIFGDSTVDTGNNNYIVTPFKGDHLPYGIDFPGHIPTGRFSNGKLVPDILASMLGLKETVPPFLQPNISDHELLTGVSFASAGSGYDELTTAISHVIPMLKQLELFKDYMQRLGRIVGEKEARRIVANALELYELGCRVIIVSGLPPIGCLPIQITAKSPILRSCIDKENSDALSYNNKLEKLLPQIQKELPGSKFLYADIYTILTDIINNPQKYGLVEVKKGCCGSGLLEAGPLCTRSTPVCANPSQYLFWDSIHPGESAYRYLTQYLAKQLLPKLSHFSSR
ncbi:GDSL esterase/lipase [Forsythia ovata]|uniref:GDSL esterase/lipase n=1 Tax=Forsythia ovata TaxID=205694 RepID=A0ABD1RJM2_9LAMI